MKRGARTWSVWAAALAASACGGKVTELPPYPEVEVVVDTDMPVPRLVSRLRVDAYTLPERRWIASRDFLRASPGDWPTSFVVVSPEPDRAVSLLVRLRAYLDGKVRDYRGERYVEAPPEGDPDALAPVLQGTGQPRLQGANGEDITPLTEPQPLLTVDRILRVRTVVGKKERVHVVLHGECVGVMAHIDGARTCVDDPAQRVSAGDVQQTPRDGDALGASVVGTFDADSSCDLPTRPESFAADGTPLFDGEVCVPKGVFIFGWPEGSFGSVQQLGIPERMARVPAFRIDRNEVTVGRWRRALADGWTPPDFATAVNDHPLPKDESELHDRSTIRTEQCTYSSEPMGRETFPMLCVRWDVARSFCQFHGGDLPLEVQWAYVGQAVMRPRRTAYPWGGIDSVLAPCTRGVFARGVWEDGESASACVPFGFGPQPVNAAIGPEGDVSLGLGVNNLAGSASEWMIDDAAALDSICWMRNALDLPKCVNPAALYKSFRGGSWASPQRWVGSAIRDGRRPTNAERDVGFRCVRAGER